MPNTQYTQSKTIIYIPFAKNEGKPESTDDLYRKAFTWFYTETRKEKIPKIIVHTKEQKNHYPGVPSSFGAVSMAPESNVYIYAHGMDDPKQITNGSVNLSVVELLLRLQADGFTPAVAKQVKSVRIYVCGIKDSRAPEIFAKLFALLLGAKEGYEHLEIHFYKRLVGSYPNIKGSHGFFHKHACEYTASGDKQVVIGRASEHKEIVRVKDTKTYQARQANNANHSNNKRRIPTLEEFELYKKAKR